MSQILELSKRLSEYFSADPKREHKLNSDMSKLVTTAYTQAMGSDESYCFKFTIPLLSIDKLYTTINIDKNEVLSAFTADWGGGAMSNNMHKDSYYQVLLLIIFYGINENKKYLVDNAMFLMMMKLWNGRRTKFFPKVCDPNIMKYVVTHMGTNRHFFTKYDSPLSLIRNYFIPSLIKKYGPDIKNNSKKLKVLFEQAFTRLRQLFVQNAVVDIKTGTKKATSGILPMYMKAKEEGLSLSSPKVKGLGFEDEKAPSFDDYTTTNVRDDIISTSVSYITMNPNPIYTNEFINTLNKECHVSSKVIEALLKSVHRHDNHETLQDLISMFLSRTNIADKGDICKPTFMELIKKNIISSKNNVEAKKIQLVLDNLLEKLLQSNFSKDFKSYSNVNQIQLRKVLIYGITYNLRKYICKMEMQF